MTEKLFKDSFIWGTATSSYQIEGAVDADGRGESIWDTFCRVPDAIDDQSSGAVACDHYNRYADDIAMIRDLGFKYYRFSIAWPRVLPTGTGTVNREGLDFYSRLVDELLKNDITPCVTLYHWDLPQTLEAKGGWPVRDTAMAFVEYAHVVSKDLGDRVNLWTTHNEPWCACMLGYNEGRHAPGRKNLKDAVAASHHMLLSHGLAVPVIRENVPNAKVGIVLNPVPGVPASTSEADHEAFRRFDGEFNRWYLDALYKGHYPQDMLDHFSADPTFEGKAIDFIKDGDNTAISVDTDFLGINYYSRGIIAADPEAQTPGKIPNPGPEMRTDMDWEVYPTGLYDLLKRIHDDYGPKELYITENGAAYSEGPDHDGRVRDHRRTSYIHNHLLAVKRAIADGVPVGGYFVWSLMDNFEWSFGYTKRFGIVYVDYETQKRYPKDSAYWLKSIMNDPNNLLMD